MFTTVRARGTKSIAVYDLGNAREVLSSGAPTYRNGALERPNLNQLSSSPQFPRPPFWNRQVICSCGSIHLRCSSVASHDFLLQEKHKRIHQVACDISGPIGLACGVVQPNTSEKRVETMRPVQHFSAGLVGCTREEDGSLPLPRPCGWHGPADNLVAPRHHCWHRFAVCMATTRSWFVLRSFFEFGIALIPTYFLSASRRFCVNQNELEATISVVEYFCIGVPVRGPSHLALRLVSC